MKLRFGIALIAISLAAASLSAADLGKYKDWGSSPQSYFMTRTERTEYTTIKSEAEAGLFVDHFLARRSPDFPAEVAKRAAMADKYLTVGNTPGSKSLRGKVVIVLGPPSALAVERKPVKIDRRLSPDGAVGALGGGGKMGGMGGPDARTVSDVANSAGAAGSGETIPQYKMTYAGRSLPTPRSSDLVLTIDVDPGGSDRINDRGTMSELDDLFEAAAQAQIKK